MGEIARLKGITFDEFKDICLFRNNLDDFEIAMRMYTLADKAIAPEEFSRAVAICTGRQLSPHVVLTVFQVRTIFVFLSKTLQLTRGFMKQKAILDT